MSDCAGILRSGGTARRCLCALIRKLVIRIGNLCIDIILELLTVEKHYCKSSVSTPNYSCVPV